MVGAGAVSLKMAADFQSATERLRTQANMTQQQVEQVRKGLLEMASSVGVAPTELANGFYHVASAATNFPPVLRNVNSELEIFRSAVELSRVGNARLEDSTQAVIGVMAAYGAEGMTAAKAAGELNAIVGSGDMKMQQLTKAMATGILPAAKTFGLSLTDVGAALATLTDNVTPADEAATRLRMSFSLLAAPSGVAQKALASIGINAMQLGYDMRKPDGLLVALTDLRSHLGHIDTSQIKGGIETVKKDMSDFGFTTEQVNKIVKTLGPDATEQAFLISKAFGGGRTSASIMTLLTEFDSFKDKYQVIRDGTKNFGADWEATRETFTQQVERIKAGLHSIAIEIGNVLMPVAQRVAGYIADTLIPKMIDMVPTADQVGAAWDRMTKPFQIFFFNIQQGGGLLHSLTGLLVNLGMGAGPAHDLANGINSIWQKLKDLHLAFDTLFFNLQHGGDLLHSLTGFFVNLGLPVDKSRELAQHLANIWNNLHDAAKDLWPAINSVGKAFGDMLPTVKEIGKIALPILVALAELGTHELKDALKWISEHGDLVRDALIAIAIGFAAIKTAEAVNGIISFTRALREAYAVAGAGGAITSVLGIRRGAAEAIGVAGEGGGILGLLSGIPGAVRGTPGALQRGFGAARGFLFGRPGTAAIPGTPVPSSAWGRGATAAEAAAAAGTPATSGTPGVIRQTITWVSDSAGAVASFGTVAASAVVNAVKSAAAWTASFAKTALEAALTAGKIVAGWVAAGAAAVANAARMVAVNAGLAIIRVGTLLWAAAQWILNIAFLGFPLVWILLAIVAVIAIVILVVTHWKQVRQVLQWVWDHMKQFGAWLLGEFRDFLQAVIDKVVQLKDWFLQKVQDILNWLKTNWPLLLPLILGPLGIALAIIITHWDQIKKLFQDGFNFVRNLAISWKDDILDAWNKLVTGITSLASSISGAITGPIKAGINDAIGVLNSFLGALYNIPVIGGAISGALHGFKLPTFAQGGLATGPSIVGEGGAPEWVIPTDRKYGARARDLWVQAGQAIGALKMGAAGIGQVGGQCVEWVEAISGHFFPVGMASQMTQYINQLSAAPGLIGVSTIPPYGHTFLVVGPNQVMDSNWVSPLVVGLHALSDIPAIAGYINLGNPLGLLASAASSAGKNVSSFIGNAIAGPLSNAQAAAKHLGGFGGTIALGLVNVLGDAVKHGSFDSGGWLAPGLTMAMNATGRRERVLSPAANDALERALRNLPGGRGALGGGDVHVHVQNPMPRPHDIGRELAWVLKTAR